MVYFVNKTFKCLITFNVDLQGVYDHIFILSCLWREFLAIEGKLEIPYGYKASVELRIIVE